MSPRGGSVKGRLVVGPSVSQKERRGTGPATTKGQERRNEILTAARRVFEERGFVETRVADIVDAAGVAQGTFYTYFDSKDAVFRELAVMVNEQMMQQLNAGRTSHLSPQERVRAGIERFVAAFRPNAVMIGLIEQVGTFTPEMAAMRLATREAAIARNARGIQRMQAEGSADGTVNARMTAEVLGAMIDQTCYVWFSLGKEMDEAEVLDTLTSVWSRAIGLRPDYSGPS